MFVYSFLSLYLIEPLTIYPSDDTLGDERLVVHPFHDPEDGDGFGFLGEEYDYLDGFAGITALAVQYRTATA